MMQQNTDRKTYEKKSIRGAVIGVVIFSAIMIVTEILMIWANTVDPIPPAMFFWVSLIVLAPVAGALIVLYIRIKEIKKGEEYEASNY